MEKFIELLRESVLLQALLAIEVISAAIYLALAGQDVPEFLINAIMLILGFYFGSKTGFAVGLERGKKVFRALEK